MKELSPPCTIAFIGLGQMGAPMTVNLLKTGYGVRGCDLSPAAREALEAAGGTAFASPAEAAAGADGVITMLPNGRVVRDALLGNGGAAAVLAPGTVVIDMSSSAPMDTRSLGEDLEAAGLNLVDAPVSGGVAKAITGTLAIMAGGRPEVVAAAKPVLAVLGGRIFETGALGSGHATKSINNFVGGAGVAAALEALVLAKSFGLDLDLLVDVLNASTGRNNATENKLKQFVLSETFAAGFGLALMAKDIGIADGLAEDMGLELPTLHNMAKLWADATAALPKGADHTELYRYLAERATAAT
ncbi:NAD(P)-dependent oxidoreductase [Acuticoccus mangrovi]|uniref:NAD(P)-dependent oxidoreductase n=1 Tax=Acuticoccus mangrovi TaxID=2796142 RepID=A0A934IRE7_9HYPH|nr:NAD(P)-dependent oxidoreductase [Acuticoccus mangrovi]MBJ3777336.1 NAD(P)-dependent oxidoreductase [Acuticoccus mangrovi]